MKKNTVIDVGLVLLQRNSNEGGAMRRIAATIVILTMVNHALAGEDSQLVARLKAGKQQTVVTYGTSLTEGGAWVRQLQQALQAEFPGLATVINSGQSRMWSKWGVDNLDARVLAKKPDTVFIEFAINDAYLDYKTSVSDARRNLTNMIARILSAKADSEIILMTMTPPTGIHLERCPQYKDYYQMYRDVARARKLRLIDHQVNWEQLLEQDKALFDKYVPDGLHPGAEGCAQVITPAIRRALGLRAEQPAKGGVTFSGAVSAANPAPATPLRQTLVGGAHAPARMALSGSDWWIHEDDSERSNMMLATAATDQPGWTPATVPGNVQTDLEAAHQLKPLFYGAGDPRVDKVATKNWWYRKDFVVPQDWAERRLGLVFEGVDFECEVWLNGRWLGAHSGMYRRFGFDLADAVQAGRTNRLAVKIHREPIPSAGLSWPQWPTAFRRHLKDLKCPGNAPGIDWSFGVYTLGIWSDVHLVATGPARIEWTRVRTTLSDQYAKATVHATLEVDSLEQVDARAGFRIVGHGATAARTTDVCLRKGRNTVEAELPLDRPALWWPNGQGAQPLYLLEAKIEEAATGRLLDSRTTRFGVREIRWEQVPGAPANLRNPLKLVVNGRPMRQMGSNLVMPDIFPGRFPQHFPRLFELAKAAGMNTLRAQ
ncbi:MAG: GDSL-type esterase/lipase family protein, partial [Kiritimatiellaeota bacterium]|nr:GDSL-type esterase/lipase family protein [Kiritimatiellota bacterium]